MFVVGRGGYRREGSITSIARGLFGRALGTSESDPHFISEGKSNKNNQDDGKGGLHACWFKLIDGEG